VTTEPSFGVVFLIGVGVVLVIGAAITLGSWFLERRERRDEQASGVQMRIAAELHRDPALAHIRIDPVARPPIGDGPMTIELSGQLPSPQLRGRVLRIAEREARKANTKYQIDDRLDIAS